jgi:hypothetical protein
MAKGWFKINGLAGIAFRQRIESHRPHSWRTRESNKRAVIELASVV